MKVYTKTGDKGQTSLVGGIRVSKACARLESYGTIDELNSFIGMLVTYCTDNRDRQFLTDVQADLFVVGSYLATDSSQVELRPTSIVTDDMISALETEMDTMDASLPPIKLFILPGGSRSASVCHVCRTVCRRAERNIIALVESGADVDDKVIAYVNRLSDYFFVLARRLNVLAGCEEVIWQRKK